MLSISPPPPSIVLIDEVIRLSGRLSSARKMTSEIAGMSPTHWLILTAICRAAEPPTVSRIARSFGQSRQSVQRIANALAAQGFIAGRDEPRDRRAPVFEPTIAGREAFAVADREGEAWAQALFDGLAPAAVATAAEVLTHVRAKLEARARTAQ